MDACINALFRIKEIPRDNTFFDNASSTTLGKQIFEGAIWDSDNKNVIPFSPEFVFFEKVAFPLCVGYDLGASPTAH